MLQKDSKEDGDSDSEGNVGSGRIQMRFQISEMKAYKTNSFNQEKGGEVVGAIHMALVAEALINYKDSMDCFFTK